MDEARAMPVRSIHSESGRALGSPRWLREDFFFGVKCVLISLDRRFGSVWERFELLLLACRVRDVLREVERRPGVPGTERLEM